MDELGKKLSDLLHELMNKTSELKELQKKYDFEQLCKQEMKEEIETLKTEVNNLKTQLDFTNKALHKCEENFSTSRDSAVTFKLNLEAATKTIEAMKEQSIEIHLENASIKKQVEGLEKDKQEELFFRESCSTKHGKTDTILNSLVKQMHDLDKDLRDVEQQTKDTISLGNKNKLLLEHKDSTIGLMKTKSEELSAKLVSLISENKSLKESLKERKPVDQHNLLENSKIFQEWQTSINEMKRRTASWEKESEIMYQTLHDAMESQMKFQKLEQAANDRSKMLELKLQELKNAEKKSCTDCSVQTDLKIVIDVACGTARVELDSVQTQTDTIESITSSESKTDRSATSLKPIPSEDGPTHHQDGMKSNYLTNFNNNNMLSSESLSSLLSRFHQEINSQSQDISELPTQINPINNKT